MDVEIRNRPSFANIHAQLGPGETITAEASAMASMSAGVDMTTRLNGGLIGGLNRRFFGSESMFINDFTAPTGGEVVLTQALPGDIECIELDRTTMFLQPGAYIASEPGVHLGLGWAGFASWVGGEGLFRLKVSGVGRVWFGGYGGIVQREIADEYVVDTGHLLAYEPSVALRVGMSGGLFSTVMGGEGLVSKLRGPGRVYMQTRAFSGLVAWTNAHL